jgi:hypothetical protein
MRSALINGYEPAQLCRLSLCISLSQSLIIGSGALISDFSATALCPSAARLSAHVHQKASIGTCRWVLRGVLVPFASLQAADPGELDLLEAGATRAFTAFGIRERRRYSSGFCLWANAARNFPMFRRASRAMDGPGPSSPENLVASRAHRAPAAERRGRNRLDPLRALHALCIEVESPARGMRCPLSCAESRLQTDDLFAGHDGISSGRDRAHRASTLIPTAPCLSVYTTAN